ncbi:UDP-glucose dehydrogenase family protein [Bradymonas sediminis]|uniref:UDP-glucose 6-dehydrogenase n=1 Tax=Bradymonas sediminis TaxID=1548548 RepID=A0A2Z4FLE2_9DELT|nr:UDP-glucose/GDP-mannose dehydrogenase family protein [Bradymonas sediminis]AWV89783.1 UDP-glucose 6-dehydrogenase [Bradymonas sediminis]TDP76470.1 UDP-glucose dehydrogenase [Bradymonas sediminis]
MKVAVIGTGYVGLVTGACLANVGNDVICADNDAAKVELLNNGGIPIYEPGLDEIVARNLSDGRIHFTTDTAHAVREADVIFIAVGTPPDEDGSADLQHVIAVAKEIGANLNGYKVVVCKSTVPVGTCERVAATIRELSDEDFDVASNPEFLKEGSAIQDFQSPDRVVIGCANREAAEKVGSLYKPFFRRSERIVYMDVRSSEMTKYASNAMLATKISFINEIANICDQVGADIEHVRTGMSLDERIGPHFIYPGVGYGGSCFPKDVRALASLGRDSGAQTLLLDAVRDVNREQKLVLYHAAKAKLGSFEGKKIAVWGLSFKPKTDDVRESAALINIRRFIAEGATVAATDPESIANAKRDLKATDTNMDAIEFFEDDYVALEGADILFIFTEWSQFRSPDFKRMKSLMNAPVIFDGRNLYAPKAMKDAGFEYFSIGRP